MINTVRSSGGAGHVVWGAPGRRRRGVPALLSLAMPLPLTLGHPIGPYRLQAWDTLSNPVKKTVGGLLSVQAMRCC